MTLCATCWDTGRSNHAELEAYDACLEGAIALWREGDRSARIVGAPPVPEECVDCPMCPCGDQRLADLDGPVCGEFCLENKPMEGER